MRMVVIHCMAFTVAVSNMGVVMIFPIMVMVLTHTVGMRMTDYLRKMVVVPGIVLMGDGIV